MIRPLGLSTIALTALVTGCGLPTIAEASSSLEQTFLDCTDEDGCGARGVPIAELVRPSVGLGIHQLDGIVERVTVSLMDRGASLCPTPAAAAADVNGVEIPFDAIGGTHPCPSALWLLREHEALPSKSEPTVGVIDDGATTIAFEFRSFTEGLSMVSRQATAAAGDEVVLEFVGESPNVIDVTAFAIDGNERTWSDLPTTILNDGTLSLRLPIGMAAGEGIIVTELQVESGPERCASTAEGQVATCHGLLRAESHHPILIE